MPCLKQRDRTQMERSVASSVDFGGRFIGRQGSSALGQATAAAMSPGEQGHGGATLLVCGGADRMSSGAQIAWRLDYVPLGNLEKL